MPRPSRNVDVQLLAAGRDLYPETGAAALSVRKVAERAGVNLGMFHYHFGSKEAFVRALLQSLYESMFADLQVASLGGLRPGQRAARRIESDRSLRARQPGAASQAASSTRRPGEAPAVEFLAANFPRHFAVVVGLIAAAQRAGGMKPLPISQAVTFVAGAVASPILLGSAIVESGLAPPAAGRTLRGGSAFGPRTRRAHRPRALRARQRTGHEADARCRCPSRLGRLQRRAAAGLWRLRRRRIPAHRGAAWRERW